MLYTIGNRRAFQDAFEKAKRTGLPVEKSGVSLKNPGGHVFETFEAAFDFLVKQDIRGDTPRGTKWVDDYGVYGLETDMENTYVDKEGVLRLSVNATLVELTKQ